VSANNGMLVPAAQKLYGVLSNLERLCLTAG